LTDVDEKPQVCEIEVHDRLRTVPRAFSIHERRLTQMQIPRMPTCLASSAHNNKSRGWRVMSASNATTDFSAWIGRTQASEDVLSQNLIRRISARFGEAAPADGDPLPLRWQWCFFQDPVVEDQLGEDGHPARGGFLPPADRRNRMWAGGRLAFIEPLRVGAS